jgi:hypothetical protein
MQAAFERPSLLPSLALGQRLPHTETGRSGGVNHHGNHHWILFSPHLFMDCEPVHVRSSFGLLDECPMVRLSCGPETTRNHDELNLHPTGPPRSGDRRAGSAVPARVR